MPTETTEVVSELKDTGINCRICNSKMKLKQVDDRKNETWIVCLSCQCFQSYICSNSACDDFSIVFTVGWREFKYNRGNYRHNYRYTRELELRQGEFIRAFKDIIPKLKGFPSSIVADYLEEHAINGYWLEEAARIRREDMGMNVAYDVENNRIIEKST